MKLLFNHVQANFEYYLSNLNVLIVFGCVLLILFMLMLAEIIKTGHITNNNHLFNILAAIYLTVILSITLFGRSEMKKEQIEEPVSTFHLLLSGNVNIFFDILFNVLLFIPAGIFLSLKLKKLPSCLIVLILTIAIETIQTLTNRGRFELIDIIANFLGGIIGVAFSYTIRFCVRMIKKAQKNHKEALY